MTYSSSMGITEVTLPLDGVRVGDVTQPRRVRDGGGSPPASGAEFPSPLTGEGQGGGGEKAVGPFKSELVKTKMREESKP
ncbi:MAG: hypothetical protein Q8K00_10205 [Syntrophales bacterium]|nr:hypothetical protein [Syntrophales bacterium]